MKKLNFTSTVCIVFRKIQMVFTKFVILFCSGNRYHFQVLRRSAARPQVVVGLFRWEIYGSVYFNLVTRNGMIGTVYTHQDKCVLIVDDTCTLPYSWEKPISVLCVH